MNTDILKHAFYKAAFQLRKHSPEILTALGIGSLCAILLILFVLPSLLVIFDKFVIKEEKEEIDEFDN